MEIYKLSDEIGEGEKVKEGGDSFAEVLTITDLKQGVKNPNRVNVFVNSKYAFSLDVAQVVELGVKVGLEISEAKLAELKKASEFGKLYQRTLEWVLMRPRSRKEVRDYLLRRKIKKSSSDALALARRYGERGAPFAPVVAKGSSEDLFDFSEEIISRLVLKGYVDDRKFAEYYVENRFVKKGVSQKRLKMELMKKGIDKDIIEEVILGRNDEEEIDKIIAKKRDRYDDEKLISYLCRQGFSYQLAQSRVLDFGKD